MRGRHYQASIKREGSLGLVAQMRTEPGQSANSRRAVSQSLEKMMVQDFRKQYAQAVYFRSRFCCRLIKTY